MRFFEKNREIFKQDKPKGEKNLFFTKFLIQKIKNQDTTTDEDVAENVQISEEINDSEEKKQNLMRRRSE